MPLTYLFSIAFTSLCFFVIVFFFKKFGIVDKPDGIRKIHKGDVALGGGAAIFISASMVVFLTFSLSDTENSDLDSTFLSIWCVSLIILILGLWDDLRPLPFSIRLIVQILASWLVIISTDTYLRDLGDLLGLGNIHLGKMGIPITIFMVVGVCNAFNMLDGMDGLVGLVLLVSSLSISLIAINNGFSELVFLSSIILAIFLTFNLGLLSKKWKIFLGDSGSMWLGFISAWLFVSLSQPGANNLFDPVTALWLISLPLIDALSTFTRRLWNRKSMFIGDRTHMHHLLMDAGLKKWKVLTIFILISLVSCAAALYFNSTDTDESLQFFGFLTIWFFYFLLMKFPETKK